MRKEMSTIFHLMSLLPTRPREFYYRMAVRLERRREKVNPKRYTYTVQSFQAMLDTLTQCLQQDVRALLKEPALQEIEATVQAGIQNIPAEATLPRVHNGDLIFGQTLYLLCRILQPENVIGTGVAYGVSSSYILQALTVNKKGTLHSIDLPASLQPHTSQYVGSVVPKTLRQRWQLHSGVSRYILPALVKKIGKLELFIHDSSHTNENMRFEFETVTPYLAPFSALVSDDAHRNAAYGWWIEANKPYCWSVVKEADKEALYGVSVTKRER